MKLKITSWNVAHLERLLKNDLNTNENRRRDAVLDELKEISPDIICLLEGPKGETGIEKITKNLLSSKWHAVKAFDGNYATKGEQWIWFLVKKDYKNFSSLLPVNTWDSIVGKFWKCHFWGDFIEKNHSHYRHPQVLVFNYNGFRVEFIGLHLKSKFVNSGESMWKAGGEKKQDFIRQTLSARIKLTTEAANVRAYIDSKFEQVENPAVFVLGDLNDGPGKEYFEEKFLFFDLISNIQGDIFFASRFLNHSLFDYPDHLRWSVNFKDFVDPERNPHILLDHILFTQGLVDKTNPWVIDEKAGKIEHEIHDLINVSLPKAAKTSDHKPVSVIINVSN